MKISNRHLFIQGKNAIVNEYTTEDKSKKAPLLYNLAELQKVMGARYKYTPDYTLELCQSLYEKHKLLSYPRTDSRYLSKDLFNVIGKHLECYRFGVFKGLLENMDISKIECESRYFNDHKVTDHHAMIPVINESAEEIYKNLTRDERNVFDAVVLSLIAIFYPEYRYTKTEIITSIGDLKFYSQGKTVLTLGYKVVLNDVEENDQEEDKQEILPALQPGDELTVDNLEIKDKLTQPPRPYSISTLINAMEKYGIGTSATRAEIIKKLQNPKRPYVKYEKSIYRSTMLGRQLIEVVPDELKNPELTRQFEESLLQVNEGKKSSDDVLREMTSELKANITSFSNQSPAVKITNDKTSYGVCPKCKKGQIYANIKGYGCSEYKQGCSFFISKTIAGKQISESMVHKLLQTGKTDIMKGFTGNKGKFSARLIIKEDKTIGFSFK